MKKTIVYLYIVGASKDPDNVDCVVPFRVNKDLIFFGPCKRTLRSYLRQTYLGDSDYSDLKIISTDLYIVGMNATFKAANIGIRKIIWAGKVLEIMTFEQAYHRLRDQSYQNMRGHEYSPLHVDPIYNADKFVGYRKNASKEHLDDNYWVGDITNWKSVVKKKDIQFNESTKEIIIEVENNQERFEVFPKDCCIVLKNIFFADGRGRYGRKINGLTITEELVNILKQAQSGVEGIDGYAVFGKNKNGNAIGKTGRWLEIQNEEARRFINELLNTSYAHDENPSDDNS